MKKLFVVIVTAGLLAVSGCSIKTQSLVDPAKQVTPSQLKAEAADIKAQLEVEKAALETKVKLTAEQLAIRNDDIAVKIEQRDYIINTAIGVVEAMVPIPYAPIAMLGITALGAGFGVVRQVQTAKAKKEQATAREAIDTLVKAVKKAGATTAAAEVDTAKVPSEVAMLIDERVRATGSDVL